MGFFGRGAREREKEELRQSWEGRLNAGLWAGGDESYFEVAREIEFEFAQAALHRRLGDPLPRDAAAPATKLMQITGAEGVSFLEDGVRSGYLVSCGETWNELDAERVRLIARECCAVAARRGTPAADAPRMRSGSALAGLVGNHPEHPRPLVAFQTLYEHIAAQSSHKRLTAAGQSFAKTVVEAFAPHLIDDPSAKPAVERIYRITWHLGVSTWIWQHCGFFKNPALEPGS